MHFMKFQILPYALALGTLAAAGAQTPAGTPRPRAATPLATPKSATPKVDSATVETAAKPIPEDAVVLSVGDQKMTKAEFERFVAALPEQVRASASGPNKRKFAEQVVELKSLAYEARRRKLDESPEVKQRIELQTENVLASELFSKLNAGVKVDEAAGRAYYDSHKQEFEEATARHILIRFKGSPVPLKTGAKELTEEEALAKAKELREKIEKGADFAEIAKAESDDTGSGANGGSLGTFTRGRMVPVFEQAAFSLPVGQLSEPLKSQFGYHIIQVQDRKSKTFEDVKSQIEERLKPEMARKAVEDVRKSVPSMIDDAYFGK